MSVIEFKNPKGQVRYQPVHPDGRRKWATESRWLKPFDPKPLNKARAVTGMARSGAEPALYRTKRRAYRQVSKLIASENIAARERFEEAK